MKYALILPDGAADDLPLEVLAGRTPLEAAAKPHIDWIATHGRQGCLRTVPEGFPAGSDVATLSVMGYDPVETYTGRAPLEAAARGLPCGPADLIFRCNLVTIADERMSDFTAGHISQSEAERLMSDLRPLGAELGVTFHAGVSYRHLMIMRSAAAVACECTPPHDIPDERIEQHLPNGPGADRVREVMRRARAMLAAHEVNRARREAGRPPATDIWLWGQGRQRPMEAFESRFGVRGACIAAVDLINGIARSVGLTTLSVAGATGYLDTDYAAKGAAAAAALDDFDLVIVHIEAPDEAGHLGDAAEKIRAIEQVDAHVVKPVLAKLQHFDRWAIAVVPDHPTPVATRKHSRTPPPFCIAESAAASASGLPFSEANAASSGLRIDPGHEFMKSFIGSRAARSDARR